MELDAKTIIIAVLAVLLVGAILIAAIPILTVGVATLFFMGVAEPVQVESCTFEPGFTCVNYGLSTSGFLDIEVGQATGQTINITSVLCSANPSDRYSNGSARWDSPNVVSFPQGIILQNGQKTSLSTSTVSPRCYKQNGELASGNVGDDYKGHLFIRYQFLNGDIRSVKGDISTKLKN